MSRRRAAAWRRTKPTVIPVEPDLIGCPWEMVSQGERALAWRSETIPAGGWSCTVVGTSASDLARASRLARRRARRSGRLPPVREGSLIVIAFGWPRHSRLPDWAVERTVGRAGGEEL